MSDQLRRKILACVYLCLALVSLASLLTYHPHDLRWEASPANHPVQNAAGIIGAYVAFAGFRGFGWAAWWLPVCLLAWAWAALTGLPGPRARWIGVGLGTLLASTSIACSLISLDPMLRMAQSGAIGLGLGDLLITYVGRIGTLLISLFLAVLASLLATRLLIISWILWTGRLIAEGAKRLWAHRHRAPAAATTPAPTTARIATTAKPSTAEAK